MFDVMDCPYHKPTVFLDPKGWKPVGRAAEQRGEGYPFEGCALNSLGPPGATCDYDTLTKPGGECPRLTDSFWQKSAKRLVPFFKESS